ncbi:MAG: TRAP transporter small permease [Clostridia bacterium]|nr:TRAP transporter small permease [Clostridia bacterium]
MKSLLKTRDIVRDIVELYIPIISFCIMFLVFVAQIICRYLLRMPLAWAYEVTVSCYLWLVVLGACYAQRHHAHVTFTLVTDKMPLRLQAFCIGLGNLLIAFAFIWSFVPSVEFVAFMARQKTSVLKIGLDIVYAPYIPFLAFTILYMLNDLILDFKVAFGLAKPDELAKYKKDNMNEVDHALEGSVEEGVSAE